MNHNIKAVTFKNGCNDVVANLYLPNDFTETTIYAALVLATPGSSVKEQIGAVYAGKLVASEFVVLVFDPSYQGESGGEPRDLEDPYVRVEDLRCAVDFLMTLPFVGEERVGILGICAGGGYAVNAALTEHRFKAVGTVVARNIGRAFREMKPKPELLKTLEEVGKQRTSEARGGAPRRDPWIPDSLEEAEKAGLTDPAIVGAVRFYRESQFRNDSSTNRLYFRSLGLIIGFDAFHLVPELLTQPLQVIVARCSGSTGSFEDGQTLFNLAPNPDKNLFVVESAGHYDMYYMPEYVDQAIARLVPFYKEHLAE